jgi:sulfur carrier protein
MKVIVKLFATLRKERGDGAELTLSEGSTLRDVLDVLEIKPEQASILFVNGRHADLDQFISDGDVISIFPPIGGG